MDRVLAHNHRSVDDMLSALPLLLENGLLRSRASGRDVLVRHSVPFDDFRSVADLRLPSDRDCIVWQRADRGQSFFGLGRAVSICGQGVDRFQSLREAAVEVATCTVSGRGPNLPLFFAGGAFDPANEHDDVWRDYAEALAFVPAVLFSNLGGAGYLTLNLQVSGSEDRDRLINRAERQINEALALFGRDATQKTREVFSCETETGNHDPWLAGVERIKSQLEGGTLQKVVLARKVGLRAAEPFSVSDALDRLRERYPNCTIFAVSVGESCFLGATPEMLVCLDGDTVSVDSLAGSAPRGAGETEDAAIAAALLSDPKERWEHDLVTQGAVAAIEPLCHAVQLPDAPVVRRMANVQHLHTPIVATTDKATHVLDLVAALHPTPATAGLPSEAAQALIREIEGFDRGWYAGPIGWFDATGSGEFAVALRSALVRGNRAWLFAGCGVVAGSDPEREYRESRLKLEAMLWALNAQQ